MPRKTAATKKTPENKDVIAPVPEKGPFLTVGVGASAGGLEALVDLMHDLPETPNAAVVLVHHSDPSHPSSMRHILARESKMKVVDLVDGMPIEPNVVFVAPGGSDVSLSGGVLHVETHSKRYTQL